MMPLPAPLWTRKLNSLKTSSASSRAPLVLIHQAPSSSFQHLIATHLALLHTNLLWPSSKTTRKKTLSSSRRKQKSNSPQLPRVFRRIEGLSAWTFLFGRSMTPARVHAQRWLLAQTLALQNRLRARHPYLGRFMIPSRRRPSDHLIATNLGCHIASGCRHQLDFGLTVCER